MIGQRTCVMAILVMAAAAAAPGDAQAPPPAAVAGDAQAPPPAAQPTPRPRQAAPVVTAGADAASAYKEASAPGAPKFISKDKWILAGYNNNEIVYQVFVTNEDTRVIRCTTDIQGTYIDNGKKVSITDRQITTVLPSQETQVGNWMDLDQSSGATYLVKCRPA